MDLSELIIHSLYDKTYRTMSELSYLTNCKSNVLTNVVNDLVYFGVIHKKKFLRSVVFSLRDDCQSLYNKKLDESLLTLIQLRKQKLKHRFANFNICNARSCYKHLAGILGVELRNKLIMKRFVKQIDAHNYKLNEKGLQALWNAGLYNCQHSFRDCLDGSERKMHFGGKQAIFLLSYFISEGWLQKNNGDRSLSITKTGLLNFKKIFDLDFYNLQ